jgi:hypothetical protein
MKLQFAFRINFSNFSEKIYQYLFLGLMDLNYPKENQQKDPQESSPHQEEILGGNGSF